MGASAAATVCAVVVTHNRRELLAECLDRLERQYRRPDHVLVVNNASTDDPAAMLSRPDGVEVLTLDDMEYTGRVLRDGHGYMVPESVAWHWTPHAHHTVADACERFYFKARNHLWLLRGSSFEGTERLGYAASYLRALLTYLRRSPS